MNEVTEPSNAEWKLVRTDKKTGVVTEFIIEDMSLRGGNEYWHGSITTVYGEIGRAVLKKEAKK